MLPMCECGCVLLIRRGETEAQTRERHEAGLEHHARVIEQERNELLQRLNTIEEVIYTMVDVVLNKVKGERSKFREKLADLQHEIWSSWMRWQFSVCETQEDGRVLIPAELVQRWIRQMSTSYSELSEKEKDSDREQADKVLALLNPLKEQGEKP